MKKSFPLLLLLGCALLLVLGLLRLAQLRFDRGDVYPVYSSLRADPLGTMAFYESLEKMPGLSVRRDFSEENRLPDGTNTVYLHLAGGPYELLNIPKDLWEDTQDFLRRGNRLVITFMPQNEFIRYDADATNSVVSTNSVETKKLKSAKVKSGEPVKPAKPKRKKKKTDAEDEDVSLEEKWGFQSGFKKLDDDDGVYAPARVVNQTDLSLPMVLDWHSGMFFTKHTNLWQVIYARGTNAVMLERQFGHGSVVLATDSYFLSNEALAGDRHADLLAWLIGGERNAMFDEAHLGIVETSGIAVLMRKYRLHGVVAGLLLVAGLFIWKNSFSLAPPPASEAEETFVAGKDSASGFVNLLRRNVAPQQLLDACFLEWKKSAAAAAAVSPARRRAAEAIFEKEKSLPKKAQDPVTAYKNIATALGTRPPPL